MPYVARTPPHRIKVPGRVPDPCISLPDRMRDVRPDGAAELKDLVAAVLQECRDEKPQRDQFLVFRPWDCPEIRSPGIRPFGWYSDVAFPRNTDSLDAALPLPVAAPSARGKDAVRVTWHQVYEMRKNKSDDLVPPLPTEPVGRGQPALKYARQCKFAIPEMPVDCFVPVPGESKITKNPRLSDQYRAELRKVLELDRPEVAAQTRYKHLSEDDGALLRYVINRTASSFWL